MNIGVPGGYSSQTRLVDLFLSPNFSPRRKRRIAAAVVLIIILPIVLGSSAFLTFWSGNSSFDGPVPTGPKFPSATPNIDGPRRGAGSDDGPTEIGAIPTADIESNDTTEAPDEYRDVDVPDGHFRVTGMVRNDEGPVPGALVVISTIHLEDIKDLEILSEEDVEFWTARTLADGSFFLPPEFEHGTMYWIMAYAAFHIKTGGTIKISEGTSTFTDMRIDRKYLKWEVDGHLDDGDPPYVLDLLERERPFVKYGLGSALMNRTFRAEVVWDNGLSTGGDLEIIYVSTCSELHSDQSIQYPSSKDNKESVSLRFDEQEVENIQGCGKNATLEVQIDQVTWARDCNFKVTVVIE